MMRKKLLLLFAILAMAVSASAYDFVVDGIYYNTLSLEDLTCEVTCKDKDYNNSCSGDIVIPSTVTYDEKTYSVTSIGEWAFRNCSGLTSVTIPSSVTSIGERAFCRCFKLTSITIPNTVTTIESLAFYECHSLTSVTIPNSVTSIGNEAFHNCYGLTSVTIPNSVTSIGDKAFAGCENLTSVTIPNSVTSIGGWAFTDCTSLTSVTIGEKVTSIGGLAFWNCSSLKEITSLATTPPAVLASNTFLNVNMETCIVIVPTATAVSLYKNASQWGKFANIRTEEVIYYTTSNNCQVSITDDAFTVTNPIEGKNIKSNGYGEYSRMFEITFNGKVTSIGDEAFSYSSITSIIIPKSVTSIGNSAFFYCYDLTSIEIPNSVTTIGEGAFQRCI